MPQVVRDLDGNMLVSQGDGSPPLTFRQGSVSPEVWSKLEAQSTPSGSTDLTGKLPAPTQEPTSMGGPVNLDQPVAPNAARPPPLLGQTPKPATPESLPSLSSSQPTGSTSMSALFAPMAERSTTFTSGAKPSKASIAMQDQAFAEQKAAAKDITDLAEQRAGEEAGIQKRLENTLADHEARAQIERDVIANRTEKAELAYNKAVDDFSKMKVDPKHYMASKSTFEKIGLALAAGLGAFASGMNHGPNYALDIIHKAADQDIAAQRDNILNAREGVNLKGNLVAQLRQKGLSFEQATIAAKQVILERAKRQADTLAAEYKSPEIAANAKVFNAQIDKEIAALKVQQSTAAAGHAQTTEHVKMAPTKAPETWVEGYGSAPDADTARKVRTAVGTRDALLNAFDRIIAFRKQNGRSFLPGTDESRVGESMALALKMKLKDAWDLGVLSDQEYKRMDAAVPKPGAMLDPTPVYNELKTAFVGESNARIDAMMNTKRPKVDFTPVANK